MASKRCINSSGDEEEVFFGSAVFSDAAFVVYDGL